MLTGLLLAAAVASVATVAPPTATVLANRTAEESALALGGGALRSAAEAKAAALALLPAGASLAGAPRLGWVHVGALAGDEELRDTPRRLAWRIRGALADGRPLEIHLDAAQLALLGWDWAR